MANSAPGLFGSSLVRKYWMAATGLFLCLFLIGHLAGNLQLFIPGEAGKIQFNEYAKFMTSNPGVMVLSYITYFAILAHVADAIVLSVQNRKARPQNYVKTTPAANSAWSSRNMMFLGTVILVFLIIHLRSFWYEMHFGSLPLDAEGNKDLHEITVSAFAQLWYTALYVAAMIGLAFHLAHGFQSGFQSLGINHKKYTPIIKKAGTAFAILIPLAFASIPVYLFISQQ